MLRYIFFKGVYTTKSLDSQNAYSNEPKPPKPVQQIQILYFETACCIFFRMWQNSAQQNPSAVFATPISFLKGPKGRKKRQ